MLLMLDSETMILHFCGGPHKIVVKSGKLWSYGYLDEVIQKVYKITENTKCGNIKSGFYSINKWNKTITHSLFIGYISIRSLPK